MLPKNILWVFLVLQGCQGRCEAHIGDHGMAAPWLGHSLVLAVHTAWVACRSCKGTEYALTCLTASTN